MTTIEGAITRIWREILELDEIGADQDFFGLGGDSLAAVRMLGEVDALLLAPVSFTDFLDAPTIAGLAAAVAVARETESDSSGAAPGGEPDARFPAASPAGTAPCSFAQERLWFLEHLGDASAAYNMPLGVRLRGPIDAGAMRAALQDMVDRHAALRTTFHTEGTGPVQVVGATAPVDFEVRDLGAAPDPETEAARILDQLVAEALSLEHGPLLKARLLALGEREHILQLVFHHMVCDGASQVVVMRELGHLYDARVSGGRAALPAPRIEYPQFAARERATLQGDALAAAVAPWLERLAGCPAALDLPTDHPRPAVPSYRGAMHRHRLPQETVEAVRSFARSVRATPFAVLLAAYYVLLYRHSGQNDIVIGATTSARETAWLDDGIGLFASTVALRVDELADGPSFVELVKRTRAVVLWAVAHERAPFDQIFAKLRLERDLSRHPVFQMFIAHVQRAPLALAGVDVEPYDVRPSTSRFDLTLFVEEEDSDALELAWEYSTDLFDAATIERFAARYLRLLEAGVAAPDMPIDDLPLLTELERASAVAAGQRAGGGYPVACMHELFEAQVASEPDAIAVRFEQEQLTYGELNARANRLARRLRALGAGAERMVALFLEPSLDLVVVVLAVVKAGAAYVPLDPEHPSDRLEFVIGDSGAELIVTEDGLLERLPTHGATVVCLGRDDAEIAAEPATDLEPSARPENVAYVIYTSGSTGRPKGVLVEHRNVARLFSATAPWFGFGPHDTWSLLHSYAFDFSVWELWGALAHGGCLVISPVWTTRSPEALADLLVETGVTVMNATPSLFTAVQDELVGRAGELALRFVVFGGEALRPPALRPWFARFGDDGPTLVNMYGITETTVHVTYRLLRGADCDSDVSPIGVPIPDLSLYLLDRRGVPVPDGVAGELYVGGDGVARGYLNRPDLNAERFIENPFGPGRLYRSGDAGRRLDGGEIEFRGRIDDQVKVRGFRIELGEIDTVLRSIAGVAESAVVALEAAPGDTRIVAYFVAAADAGGAGVRDRVWRSLQETLPGYMVPAAVTELERMPLTRNGKLDKRELPVPSWEKQLGGAGAAAPLTDAEARVAEIWRSVLGVDEVGREDNFFHLGGHSLLAARVATQVRDRFEIAIGVRSLFSQPTLAGFAAEVDALLGAAAAAADPAPSAPVTSAGEADEASGTSDTTYPLSFPQQQMVFIDELDPGSTTYNAALALRLTGPLHDEALRSALAVMFERHEALRSVVVWEDGAPRQRTLAEWSVELPVVDLSGVPAAERDTELQRQLVEAGLRPFDLTRALMLRTTLFRLGPREHVILFAPHHIAFDAWAVEVLYRELGELYAAKLEGRPPALPELPMQYRDFVAWQRNRMRGEVLDAHQHFWRTHLAGAPAVLSMPTDRPRPADQTFEGSTHIVELGQSLADGVRALCADEQVTPYILLLATFATLLYRRSGQDDILFSGPMANRDRPGLEHLIGFFANTIVTRVRLGGNPRFDELLARTRDSVLASYEHQEVPLELVVEAVKPARDPGVNPLVQVNFRVRVGEPPTLALRGTTAEPVPVDLGLARFDLSLELHLLADLIEAEFNFNTDLYDRATIERLAADFERLLGEVVTEPATRLLAFDLGLDPSGAPAAAADPGVARPIRSRLARRPAR